jgi:hypothetical protein
LLSLLGWFNAYVSFITGWDKEHDVCHCLRNVVLTLVIKLASRGNKRTLLLILWESVQVAFSLKRVAIFTGKERTKVEPLLNLLWAEMLPL